MITGRASTVFSQVRQAALLGFLVPFLGVVVAVEDDLLALLDDARQQLLDRLVERPCRPWSAASSCVAMKSSDSATIVFSTVFGPAIEMRAADGAELELVAGERERAGAVAVAGVARQLRQHARRRSP